jgi:hypothetical protein
VLPAEPGALQGWNPTRRIDLAVAAVMVFSAASTVETMTMPRIYERRRTSAASSHTEVNRYRRSGTRT